jgi:hypothetical protein
MTLKATAVCPIAYASFADVAADPPELPGQIHIQRRQHLALGYLSPWQFEDQHTPVRLDREPDIWQYVKRGSDIETIDENERDHSSKEKKGKGRLYA